MFSDFVVGFLFIKKALVTAVFVAGGWFGGDFTPNMAWGASAGNVIAGWMRFPIPILGAALGLFLPVASTHGILATGWVMTLEYFGWKVAVLALPVYLLAWVWRVVLSQHLYPRLHHPVPSRPETRAPSGLKA